jgi:hypothetical protein
MIVAARCCKVVRPTESGLQAHPPIYQAYLSASRQLLVILQVQARNIVIISASRASFPNWDSLRTMFHFESSQRPTFAFPPVNRRAH